MTSATHKAHFEVPFNDFDYEGLAKDCGCTQALHCGFALVVVGTEEAIGALEKNLSFSWSHLTVLR